MDSDVQKRIAAGILTALDRWIRPHPPTQEIRAFTLRHDDDPGFRQLLQKDVVLSAAFRRHRDHIAYLCLKTILFPQGAVFDDDLETSLFGKRQAYRVKRDAAEAGLLRPIGKARHDKRVPVMASPFLPDEDAFRELATAFAIHQEERARPSAVTPIQNAFQTAYGPRPLHQLLAKHLDEYIAYAFLAGLARGLQLEFADDWRHCRASLRRWLTALEHKPGLDKPSWNEFRRSLDSSGLTELFFHKVTIMLLVDWFARRTREDQIDLLRTPATYSVTPQEALAAYDIRMQLNDPILGVTLMHGIPALHELDQTEAALAVASTTANDLRHPLGGRAVAHLRYAQIIRTSGREKEAQEHFRLAAQGFREVEQPFLEGIAEQWQTAGSEDPEAAAARDRAAKAYASLTRAEERFCYHTHAALMAALRDDVRRERHHLLEALRTDALQAGDTPLHDHIQQRLSYLQAKTT